MTSGLGKERISSAKKKWKGLTAETEMNSTVVLEQIAGMKLIAEIVVTLEIDLICVTPHDQGLQVIQ